MRDKFNIFLLLAMLFSLMACKKTSSVTSTNNNNGPRDSLLQVVVYEKEFPDQQWIPSGSLLGNTEMGYIVLSIPELTHISYYYLSIQQMVAGGNWEEVEYRPDISSAVSAYFAGSLRQNFYIDEAWQNGRIRIYNPFRRMSPIKIRVRAIM